MGFVVFCPSAPRLIKCLIRANPIEVARNLEQRQWWALTVAKSSPKGRIQTPRKEPHAPSSKSTRKSYTMQEFAVKPQFKFILFCFKRTPVAGTLAGKANRKLARLGPLLTRSTITAPTTATDLQGGKALTLCMWRGRNGVILSTTSLLSFCTYCGQTSLPLP